MKFLLFILFYYGLILKFGYCKCERKNSVSVRTYKINLDDPPVERFVQVTNDYRKDILRLFDAEKKRYEEILIPLIDYIGGKLEEYFPYPFNEEIRGIAKTLDTKIGEVVLFQILYDLTANKNRHRWCTSILSRMNNGQIIHGRNLDYDYPELLMNLVYTAKFYRNGSLVFTSAQFAGHIGVVTGHKQNMFTFSINERNKGPWWYNVLYGLLDKKATPLSFLTRHLMENVTSYDNAVNYMSKTDLIAPAYFIIGGVKPNEATILTRNQTHLIDAWKLNQNSNNFDRWFLIETNYDHWSQPPDNDDRRNSGINAMKKKTQANLNYETLLDVLTQMPVCNNMTVYSVVMSARDNEQTGYEIIIH